MRVYGGRGLKPVDLDKVIARGGEGVIYEVAGQEEWVAKIYSEPQKRNRSKVVWMEKHPPPHIISSENHPTIAWPNAALYSSPIGSRREKSFVGYLMPRVKNAVLLLDLLIPKIRLQALPDFDLRYLYRTARNLATAIQNVHDGGYVIGDINESNVLVTPDALVTIIDADSFQVRSEKDGKTVYYYCLVGKPEYLAPELQGQDFSSTARNVHHDAFALGVLIFQLLLDGRHPFQIIWNGDGDPPSNALKIKNGWYPYSGSIPRTVLPPPNSGLHLVDPEVTLLFRKCFVEGHKDPEQRPTPGEWVRVLGNAELRVVKCACNHLYLQHIERCPKCGANRKSTSLPEQSNSLDDRRCTAILEAKPLKVDRQPTVTRELPTPVALAPHWRLRPSPNPKIKPIIATPADASTVKTGPLRGARSGPSVVQPVTSHEATSVAATAKVTNATIRTGNAQSSQAKPLRGTAVPSSVTSLPRSISIHPALRFAIRGLILSSIVIMLLSRCMTYLAPPVSSKNESYIYIKRTVVHTLPVILVTEITATPQPTPTPTKVRTPTPTGKLLLEDLTDKILAFTKSSVNLREGPSIDYPIAAVLLADTQVELLGRTEDMDWLYVLVRTTHERGWLHYSTITPADSISDLVVVREIPTLSATSQ